MAEFTLQRLRENDRALTRLVLHRNRIVDSNVVDIAAALRTNTVLQELSFSQNFMGNAGARALADMLLHNTTLTRLDLHDTLIGDAGAIALADALQQNTTLTIFYFGGNRRVGEVGARALARAIVATGRNAFGEDPLLYRMVDEEKRRIKYDNARRAAWTLLLMGVQQRKKTLEMEQTDEVMLAIFTKTPNDVFVILAKKQWDSRDDEDLWLFDPAERDAQGAPAPAAAPKRARHTEACLGCLIGTPALFHEQHDTSRRFCSAYCQLVHYYQLPDLRGMTPAQIERALAG